MYYYKSKDNKSFLGLKTPLWRETLQTTTNENGEEVQETYTEEELTAQATYSKLTEQEWNDHQSALHPQPTAEQIALQNKRKEMAEIQVWLNEHDYIINKHLLGEYSDTDTRWTTYLAERAVKLARYNELEEDE